MIARDDILSMEFLKKSIYTGGHKGMRYRLEKSSEEDEQGESKTILLATVWPEPFNYITTPAEQKMSNSFPFDEDGVTDAIAWMNDIYFEKQKDFEEASKNWDTYRMNNIG